MMAMCAFWGGFLLFSLPICKINLEMEYIVIFDGLICRSITSIVGSDSSELEQLRVKIFFFLSIINITHTLTALEDCKVDYNCEYGSFS